VPERLIEEIKVPRKTTFVGREYSELFNPQPDFIKSKNNLWDEVAKRGVIEVFSDVNKLAKDLAVGIVEMKDLKKDPIYGGLGVPRGDGSPVRILGGFGSSQVHYFDSARAISRAGYEVKTLPWGNLNVKNPLEMAPYMMPELISSKKETGKRAKLVVHSLGGYDAAAMFAMYPQQFVDSVEHVVFVGSPRPKELNSALALSYLVLHMFEKDEEFGITERLTDLERAVDAGFLKVTSVDSSYDPVVRGEHLGRDENHYVIDNASHSALGMNRHTIRAVAHAFAGEEVDSLAYPNIHHPAGSLAA